MTLISQRYTILVLLLLSLCIKTEIRVALVLQVLCLGKIDLFDENQISRWARKEEKVKYFDPESVLMTDLIIFSRLEVDD